MPEKINMARRAKEDEAGFREVLDRYRQRVDIEIAKASEYGARWWSRRLVELHEDTGLVELDKSLCLRELQGPGSEKE